MRVLLTEIERIYSAEVGGNVMFVDMWAEELAARVNGAYAWDESLCVASISTAAGPDVKIGIDSLAASCVWVSVEWGATGIEDRKSVAKYLAKAPPQIVKVLGKAGFHKPTINREGRSVGVHGTVGLDRIRSDIDSVVDGIRTVVGILSKF